MMESVTRIAESASFIAIARISMIVTPLLVSVIVWAAPAYLDSRFEGVKESFSGKVDVVSSQVASLQREVAEANEQIEDLGSGQIAQNMRITSIETARAEARRAADQRNEQLLAQMGQMQQAITELTKQVAAMTAVIQMRNTAKR